MRRLLIACMLLMSSVVLAQDDEPLPLYALPDAFSNPAFRSSSMAVTQAGRLIVTNTFEDTVSIIEPWNSTVTAELSVPDEPRSVAITRDSAFALIVSREEGALTIMDIAALEVRSIIPLENRPVSIVTDSNQTAYIALEASHEIIEVDLNSGDILRRIPTNDYPAGMALWGDFLYVTHFWSGDISLIYLPDSSVVRVIQTGADTSLSPVIWIEPRAEVAYVPQSIANTAADPGADNQILPVINIIDLNSLRVVRSQRIGLHIADRPLNMPFDITLDRAREYLYVVNAGSDSISVIDLNTGLAVGHIPVGANPRSITFSRDNNFVYAHNLLDGTLSIIDPVWLSVTDTLPIRESSLPVDVWLGAQLFHAGNDPRLSSSGMISCASCHFAGMSDGREWGGQPTPEITSIDAAFLNAHIQELQGGSGFDADPVELDALVAYLRWRME